MRIGIDANEANVSNHVGIGEYSYNLIEQFYKSYRDKHDFKLFLKTQPNFKLKPDKNWEYEVIGPKKLWTQFALPINLMLRQDIDIFFTPSHYSPRFINIPYAVSVMDMSFEYYPELFAKKDLYQLKNWTKYSVKKASLVFTISNASKNDIINIYNIESDKIVVTYPGIKEHVSLDPDVYMQSLLNENNIKPKYFLFVGTIQPRKNIKRLIEAFSILLKKNDQKDIDLVIVGKRGWLFDEILSTPEKLNITDHVKFLDFVDDSKLRLLYKNAVCFVFPSLYEGFGLPILEAMKNKCPVITSNISSMPEAGGEAALYVDPESTDEICNAMDKVLKDKKLRGTMIEKGLVQVARFSWEKSAVQTMQALESLNHKYVRKNNQ